MRVHVNLLNAKTISVEVQSSDTVKKLKEIISKATGISPASQRLSQKRNGKEIDRRTISVGNLIKPDSLIYVAYKELTSINSFYINAVTGKGRVLTVTLEEGQSSTVNDLRRKLSSRAMLGVPVRSLFLRRIDSSFKNKCLAESFNSLEESGVNRGSVVFVQIHPYEESWFHGKISCDQAEQIMSSAIGGQFLIKESLHYPGDYVIFVRIDGKTRHWRVSWSKTMQFTIDDQEYFDSITSMVKYYQNNTGCHLPIKLTEPVSRQEVTNGSADDSSLRTGEDDNLERGSLYTNPVSEINLTVIVGQDTYSLLTSPFYQVDHLKKQVEELSGVPVDSQLLRLNDKALVMHNFSLRDHHILNNATIHVQVHPWNEDWYVGKMSEKEIESVVKKLGQLTDGMFLIRDSSSSPGDYALLVWFKGRRRSYRVSYKNQSYNIEEKLFFGSLSQLVEHYKCQSGLLQTLLTEPVKFNREQQGLIPPAFLARGPKAKEAYRRALEHGKTCDIRVRVMLIGQDHAGKTSVKRSLKGDEFNRDEARTAGVQMDPPLLRVGKRPWKPESISNELPITMFDHKSAQLVARQLSRDHDEPIMSPSKSATSDVHNEKPEDRQSLSNGVHSEGDDFNFEKNHTRTSIPSSGYGSSSSGDRSSRDSPTFPHIERKVLNVGVESEGKNPLLEPTSPIVQDEVFARDPEPFRDLSQEIMTLVERILKEDNHSVGADQIWPVIWDFAGQSLYHALHPIFMSREAVYLLVSDLSKDLFEKADDNVKQTEKPGFRTATKSESSLDHLMKWMDLVHSFQDPTLNALDIQSCAQPPVILVGTHVDKVTGDPWDAMNNILKSFEGKAFSCHIVDDKFVVDNTRAGQPFEREDQNVQRLREKIISVASTLPHTKQLIPLQWLRVEKLLHRLASKGYKHITKMEFREISNKICQFEVEEDSEELLHFLCDCGAVLYFSHESNLSNSLVILDPQWLINVFCEILKSVPSKKDLIQIREKRRILAEDGILSKELINYTCKKLDLQFPQETLLSIMEKCNLICRWNEQNGKEVYLVPSMFTAKPDGEISGLIGQGKLAPIYIQFSSGYVPYGLFCRFLTLFGQQISPKCPATPPKLFANAARFFLGQKSNYNLTIACFKSVIAIHLLFEGKCEVGRETASISKHICRLVFYVNKCHLESHNFDVVQRRSEKFID
ncbi:uncharacterized protein LOC111332016 [Stylophora pistillata]|uniref:uncharacterized protein LOC111332016 n=1 Tax=Stylophora pistillata TaxID=50429 RepID=UPI000C04266B|nr:uncharacterized protein LOC111332016 [Stylophora pistillata]